MAEEKKVTEENTEFKSTENKPADLNAKKKEVVEIPKKKIKKIKRQISKGKAMIKCTYNNTMVSITDMAGNLLGWSSAGLMGFKGAKKSTPYAATQVVGSLSEKIKKFGVHKNLIRIVIRIKSELNSNSNLIRI
ncbi:MAG: 30S ribosomal protein S11 [Candidatus Moranbacteria bacterium]|nr:30S ribosomal protein S11 [Candidatus Moranbacteria bacterium]